MTWLKTFFLSGTIDEAKSKLLLAFSFIFGLGGTASAAASWGYLTNLSVNPYPYVLLPSLMLVGPAVERLTHRRHLSGRLFLIALYLNIMVVCATLGGLLSTSSIYLLVLPLLAGLLFGRPSALLWGSIVIASVLGLWIAGDATGRPLHGADPAEWTYSVAFVLCFTAAGIAASTMVYQGLTEGLTVRLAKASETALAANEAKAKFLSSVSHDIRTPMNGVLASLSLIAQRDDLPDDLKDMVDLASESSQGLLTVINQIIDVSRTDVGPVTLNAGPFQPRRDVESVIFLHEASARAKGLVLTGDVTGIPATLQLKGDGARLRLVLTSLVGNAIQYTQNGSVTVLARARADHRGQWTLTVSVRDTGPGIAPAEQSRLFDGFRNGPAGRPQTADGTGLGLVISYNVMKAMGGTLTVDSAPGRGSTFEMSVSLPTVSLTERVPRRARRDWSSSLSGLNVLVAEDDSINQVVIGVILDTLDCKMSLARNGHEALGAIQGQDFDLMLLDIGLPGMDGVQVFNRMRDLGPDYRDLPVIAVTARALSGDRERFLALGMDGYVAKPFEASALVTEIRRVLGAADEAAEMEPLMPARPTARSAAAARLVRRAKSGPDDPTALPG
ncbi:MAG: response regulator [Alphaproteobacteria bacterium]